ncbi:membrane fusion protein [Xanthomonas arboricola]|uniref:HlyD family secretion protein n=1 Tax=Xanthomonas euroxanthea TaxID=2259622 RepID=UPI0016152E02|nr:HlyD family efflux transporter periplasmic adaptor subunit [Xanthomonas euroxanthea]MBB3815202.1 membrane fusion protein [Xanthomonas euroxanthea]
MTDSELFRREALERLIRTDGESAISVTQPVGGSILAMGAAVFVLVGLGFCLWMDYRPRTAVSGSLVPSLGQIDISAPRDSLAQTIAVREGAHVAKGDELVRLVDPTAQQSGTRSADFKRNNFIQQQDALNSIAQVSLLGIEKETESRQAEVAAKTRQLGLMKQEVKQRQEQVAIEEQVLKQFLELSNKNYVSKVQVSQQRVSVLSQRSSLTSLEQQIAVAQGDLVQLNSSLAQLAVDKQRALYQQGKDLGELQLSGAEALDQADFSLQAPVSGIVTSRLIDPGQAVKSGQPLLSIVPDGSKMQARLLVPSSSVRNASVGSDVALRISSSPYQVFGLGKGTIISISKSALPAGAGKSSGEQDSEAYYAAWVEISSQEKKDMLSSGTSVQADILGAPRPVYSFIFEPLRRWSSD